ncbi:MAG: UDP-N-acetylmuramoyl-tripeptide--D-alanyl-D-alanine ligase [Candidatus Omnitrophica bacterium]|nr:UDP-N-acetylmuramoyl-tripeptide--D-alanyl-D-alanine ligase [Candidatus Omnitrophota bacterium]MBU1870288.1 UDP-N-acetylmuramoyl-tripeptide--D-alanyl-D-alanine ligase [Candidatus Omnitrophota bacterium]
MFKVSELVRAAKGKLLCGNKDAVVKGISIDSRTIKPLEVFVAIKGENFDGHDFVEDVIGKGAGCVIVRPGSYKARKSLGAAIIEVKDTINALGDIARYQRRKFGIPVVAVTGSNGKTTTKEMISWVLSRKFKVLKNEGTKNNNIGLPMTLVNLDESYDIAVLELGTNHPGEIEYLAKVCEPNIGVITNIGESHLEFLRDLEGVFREKSGLIKNLKRPCISILNADDSLLSGALNKKGKNGLSFGISINRESDFFASGIKAKSGRLEFLLNQKSKCSLNTPGRFNVYNALFAAGVAVFLGMEYKDITGALSDFGFPKNRLRLIELGDVRFIDDTYNSNPFSLRHALEALNQIDTAGRKIVVMGDMLELGECKELLHYEAGQKAASVCDVFISVGKLSEFAVEAMRSSGFDLGNLFSCENSIQAREVLFTRVSPGKDDIILVKGSRGMKMEEVFKI